MGRTYGVPRSAKGESRILYIFTIKSLAITIAFGGVGFLLVSLLGGMLGLVPKLIVTVLFGGIGYVIGAAKIPDSPMMGPLQKAGGEEILSIIIRMLTFGKKKKLYVYGLTREKAKVANGNKGVDGIKKMLKK